MEDEARREEILRLSFRWQHLRDRSELLEHYGHDASEKRRGMAEIQEKIAALKEGGQMEAGDRVEVVANTYLGGTQKDHRGRMGVVLKMEHAGCLVQLDETAYSQRGKFFFEYRELERI